MPAGGGAGDGYSSDSTGDGYSEDTTDSEVDETPAEAEARRSRRFIRLSQLSAEEIAMCESPELATQLFYLARWLRLVLLTGNADLMVTMRRHFEADISIGLLETDIDDLLDRSVPLNELTTKYLWYVADTFYHAQKQERLAFG